MKSEKKEQTNQPKTEKQKAWSAPKHHEIKMKGVTFNPFDLLEASGE